jgi:hypothetical protein
MTASMLNQRTDADVIFIAGFIAGSSTTHTDHFRTQLDRRWSRSAVTERRT